MKRYFLIILILIICFPEVTSQGKYFTSAGSVRFFSKAPLENIEATSNELRAAIDISNGDMLLIVPIESFVFEKSLMQRHFNDQYMESHKYPEARFSGKIIDFNPIPAYYKERRTIRVNGKLTIHGVTKEITESASLHFNQDHFVGVAIFNIALKDYNIRIPRMFTRNIAESVEVTINVKLGKQLP